LRELSLKAKAIKAIAGCKGFVLITDKESLALAELDSLTKAQALAVMKHLTSEMKRVSKDIVSKANVKVAKKTK